MWKRMMSIALVVGAVAGCADRETPTDAADHSRALSNGSGVQESLFTVVPSPRLNAEQQARLTRIRNRRSSADVNVGLLRAAPAEVLQVGRAVGFDVGPNVRFVATGTRRVRNANGTLSWSGSTDRAFGVVQLVLTEKGVTGTLRAGASLYRFEPIGGGLHALIKSGTFPPEHPPESPTGAVQPALEPPSGSAPVKETESSTTSVPTSIDVLVAYTPAVTAAVMDVAGLVQLAIDETNTSYSNSGVNATMRSVYSSEVTYSEAGRTYQQHVAALQSTSDGIMDIVHTWRNQYFADVVVLLVDDPAFCGLASQVLATQTTAFAAVYWDCATGYYSFGHEIGHLQGARHDRFVDSNNSPYAYGHGYVDPLNYNWRTIMAYDSSCIVHAEHSCTRVQYWSNPNITYPPTSQAMGTATYEHDARVLDETKTTIANFRSSLVVTLTGPTYSVGSTNTCQWTATITGGTPPYTYSWSTWWGSPSAEFGIISGQGTASVSTYGHYDLASPPTTNVGVSLSGSDAAGQPYNVQQSIVMDNNASGCRSLLAATWTGPTRVGHTNTCQWTATATGGTPPYYYNWSASWTSQSTGFYFTSGQGTSNASSYGYYYGTFPPTTDIRVSLGVSDAGGQVYSLDRSIIMDNYPSGCQ